MDNGSRGVNYDALLYSSNNHRGGTAPVPAEIGVQRINYLRLYPSFRRMKCQLRGALDFAGTFALYYLTLPLCIQSCFP